MMNIQSGRPRYWLRLTASVITLIFSCNTVIWADGTGNVLSARSRPLPSEIEHVFQPSAESRQGIGLPQELGQIKQAFHGSRKGLVVHIQDAHVNEEAQRRIAGIIDYFARQHGAKLVSVEGASGEIAHQLLSNYPDQKARKIVSDYFLGEGMLTGPEYSAISEHPELVLFGAEDRELYEENRKVFLEASDFKKRDEIVLTKLRKAMEGVGRHVFSEGLGKLLQQKRAFQGKEKELVPYVEYLGKLSEKGQVFGAFPQIHNFLKLIQTEHEINFEQSEKEARLFTRTLKNHLAGEALSSFLSKTDGFRSGKISRGEYFSYLASFLPQIQGTSKFSNLKKYLEYIRLSESINVEIFTEIDQLEESLKEKMFRNQEERDLDRLFRFLEIYEKMFDFSLTKEQADFFYQHRQEFKAETFGTFLRPLLEKYHFDGEIKGISLDFLDGDLLKIERFYQAALKRDNVLISYAISKMEAENQPVSIIVTGGFHTPGIERALRERGYSYFVIAPRLTKAINEAKESERYLKAMRSEPTRLAQLLSEAHFPAQSGLANDPRYQLGVRTRLPLKKDVDRISQMGKPNPQLVRSEMRFTSEFADLLAAASLFFRFNGSDLKNFISYIRPDDVSADIIDLLSKDDPLVSMLYSPFLKGSLTRLGEKSMVLVSAPFVDGTRRIISLTPRTTSREYSTRSKNFEVSYAIDDYNVTVRLVSAYDWKIEREKAVSALRAQEAQRRSETRRKGEVRKVKPSVPVAQPTVRVEKQPEQPVPSVEVKAAVVKITFIQKIRVDLLGRLASTSFSIAAIVEASFTFFGGQKIKRGPRHPVFERLGSRLVKSVTPLAPVHLEQVVQIAPEIPGPQPTENAYIKHFSGHGPVNVAGAQEFSLRNEQPRPTHPMADDISLPASVGKPFLPQGRSVAPTLPGTPVYIGLGQEGELESQAEQKTVITWQAGDYKLQRASATEYRVTQNGQRISTFWMDERGIVTNETSARVPAEIQGEKLITLQLENGNFLLLELKDDKNIASLALIQGPIEDAIKVGDQEFLFDVSRAARSLPSQTIDMAAFEKMVQNINASRAVLAPEPTGDSLPNGGTFPRDAGMIFITGLPQNQTPIAPTLPPSTIDTVILDTAQEGIPLPVPPVTNSQITQPDILRNPAELASAPDSIERVMASRLASTAPAEWYTPTLGGASPNRIKLHEESAGMPSGGEGGGGGNANAPPGFDRIPILTPTLPSTIDTVLLDTFEDGSYAVKKALRGTDKEFQLFVEGKKIAMFHINTEGKIAEGIPGLQAPVYDQEHHQIIFQLAEGKLILQLNANQEVVEINFVKQIPVTVQDRAVLEVGKELENLGVAGPRSEVRQKFARRTFLISTALVLGGPTSAALVSAANAEIASPTQQEVGRLQRYLDSFNEGFGLSINEPALRREIADITGKEIPKRPLSHITRQEFEAAVPNATQRKMLVQSAQETFHDVLGLPNNDPDVYSSEDWAEKLLQQAIVLFDIRPAQIPEFLKFFKQSIEETKRGMNFEQTLTPAKLKKAFGRVKSIQDGRELNSQDIAGIDLWVNQNFSQIKNIRQNDEVPEMFRNFVGVIPIGDWVKLNEAWVNTSTGKSSGVKLDTFLGIAMILAKAKYNHSLEVQRGLDNRKASQMWHNPDHFFSQLYFILNRPSHIQRNFRFYVTLHSIKKNFSESFGSVFLEEGRVETGGMWRTRTRHLIHYLSGARGQKPLFRNFKGPNISNEYTTSGPDILAGALLSSEYVMRPLYDQKRDPRTKQPVRTAEQILSWSDLDIVEISTRILIELMNDKDQVLQDLYRDHDDRAIQKIFNDWLNKKYTSVVGTGGEKGYTPPFIPKNEINAIDLSRLNWDMQALVRSLRELQQEPDSTGAIRESIRRDMIEAIVGLHIGRAITWVRYGLEEGLVKVIRNPNGTFSLDMSLLRKRLTLMKEIAPYVEMFVGRRLNLNDMEDMGLLGGMAEGIQKMGLHNPQHFIAILLLGSDREGIKKVATSYVRDKNIPEAFKTKLRKFWSAIQKKGLEFETQGSVKEMLAAVTGNPEWAEKGFTFTDPKTGPDQIGFVISWVMGRITEGWERTGGMAASIGKTVNEVGLKKILDVANEFWPAFGKLFGRELPPIGEDLFEMNSNEQGRFIAFLREVASDGWENTEPKFRGLAKFFDDIYKEDLKNGNHAKRDALLKATQERQLSLLGLTEQDIKEGSPKKPDHLPITDKNIWTNPRAQGSVISQAAEMAEKYINQAKADRSEVRSPISRRRFFKTAAAGLTGAAVLTGVPGEILAKEQPSILDVFKVTPAPPAAQFSIAEPGVPSPNTQGRADDLVLAQLQKKIDTKVSTVQPGGLPTLDASWQDVVTEVLEQHREQIIKEVILLRQARANRKVAESRRTIEEGIRTGDPAIIGDVISWTRARVQHGWEETEGLAERIAEVLRDDKKRDEIFKESEEMVNFYLTNKGEKRISIRDALEKESTDLPTRRLAEGSVIGQAHFRVSKSESIEESWKQTAGVVQELINTLKKVGPEYLQAVAQLYFLDDGMKPEDAKRQAKAKGATALKFFVEERDRWNYLTGYTGALILAFRESLTEIKKPAAGADPIEKFTSHTTNFLYFISDPEIRDMLKEYYVGINLKNVPLDPFDELQTYLLEKRNRHVLREIWGEYAVRLKMIEELQGRYNLLPEEIKKTMKELLEVQKEAQKIAQSTQPPWWHALEDAEVYYFWKLFYTTSVREEIMIREEETLKKVRERKLIPYSDMGKDPKAKPLTVKDFFELIAFMRQARIGAARTRDMQDSAVQNKTLVSDNPDYSTMERGILETLNHYEEFSKDQPFWMTPKDLERMKGVILGFGKERGLKDEPVLDGEAVQAVTYYLNELAQQTGGRWPGILEAKRYLMERSRLEMFLQASYMLHHYQITGEEEEKDKNGGKATRRLGLPDISHWVTVIQEGRFSPEDVAGFIRDDGYFETLERELLKKAEAYFKKKYGEEKGKEIINQFPQFDPWRRLGFVTRMGFIIRMHELGFNGKTLDHWFEDVFEIQKASYNHIGQFIDPVLLSYTVDRFREGHHRITPRMEGVFKTTARQDPTYMDLEPKGNLLRRFLYSWQNIFHALPSEYELQWGLRQWDRLAQSPYLKNRPVSELEAAQRELIARFQMAETTLIHAIASQIYGWDPEASLESRIPVREIRDLVAGPLIELMDRLPQRDNKREQIRNEKLKETEVLEPLRTKVKEDRARAAGTFRGGETEASVKRKLKARYQQHLKTLKPESRKDYPSTLSPDRLKFFMRSMKEKGYTIEEVFLRYVELEDRIGAIYRKLHKIPSRSLTPQQRYFVSSIVERIFIDWGVREAVTNQKEVEDKLGMTIDQGIEKELERLEGVLADSLKIREFLKTMNIEVDEPKAYQMADNSRNSAVTIDEIKAWLMLAKGIQSVVNKIKADGQTVQISDDYAMYLADSWLKIGLAKVIKESGWPQEKVKVAGKELSAKDIVRNELSRIGMRDPRTITLIADQMAAREIKPVQMKLLVDKVIEVRQMLNESLDRASSESIISGQTRTPMGDYDRWLGVSNLDLLVYLDDLTSHPTSYIGLLHNPELGYTRERLESIIAGPVNAMFKDQINVKLRASIPESILQKDWSEIEKIRLRAFKEHGWGNVHTWAAGSAILSALSFLVMGIMARRHNVKLGQDEEDQKITARHFLHHWFNKALTLSAVLFILISLNYSFFVPSTLIFWTATLYYLLLVIPDKYLAASIEAFLVWTLPKYILSPISRFLGFHTRESLVEPYSIGELQRIPDANKFTVSVAFPMRGEDKPIDEWSDINNFNQMLGDPAHGVIGDAQKLLEESRDARSGQLDPNLYFTLIVQVFPRTENTTKTDADRFYNETMELILSRLQAMPPDIQKRLYVAVRRAKLTKPATHYMLQEWMRQNDNEYVLTDPRYNVDPDYTAPGDYRFQRRGPKADDPNFDGRRRIPFVTADTTDPDIRDPRVPGGMIGGDPRDPNDLRNIRQRNIRSGANAADRTDEIFGTLVYDPGNAITYQDLLHMISVMADSRNKQIMYLGKMEYTDKYATLHSFLMKWFPQRMLGYTWIAQAWVEGETRPPGKYAYRNNDTQLADGSVVPGFYRRVIRSRGYERVWPFYGDLRASDDILPKSEDEIMGILSGGAKLIPRVTIFEDPMFNYPQEKAREDSRWRLVFDWPQIMVLRVMPFVRDHPLRAAALVGFVPAFILVGIIGTSFLTWFLSVTAFTIASFFLFKGWFLEISRILRESEGRGEMHIPKLSPGQRYESNLVVRGQISEPVWLLQLIVTFKAMLSPGTLEVGFPYMGEIAFQAIMLLLVHPKFHLAIASLFQGVGALLGVGELYKRHGRLGGFFLSPFYALGFLFMGLVEFVASTTIFLPKILTTPWILMKQVPQVIDITYFHLFGRHWTPYAWWAKSINKEPLDPNHPPRLTWQAAVVGASNPLFIEHLKLFKVPFVVMLTTLTFLAPAALPFAVVLIAGPVVAVLSILGTSEKFRSKIPFLSKDWIREWAPHVFILSVLVTFSAFLPPGIIPKDLILRASTILIAAFGFAAGWSWLFGLGKQIGGKYQSNWMVQWGAYALGTVILTISIIATFFPAAALSAIAHFPLFAFAVPGLDSTTPVYLMWLTLGEQLHLNWYFVIFYTTIVASSVMIGVTASVVGLLHSIYVLNWKFFKENPRAKKWIAVIMGIFASLVATYSLLKRPTPAPPRPGIKIEKKEPEAPETTRRIEAPAPDQDTIFNQGGWKVTGTKDTGKAASNLSDSFSEFKVYNGNFQIFSIKGNGYMRSTLPGLEWGTSLVTSGYWTTGNVYHHNAEITEARLEYNPAKGSLVLRGKLVDENMEADDFRMEMLPIVDGKSAINLSFTLRAHKQFSLDRSRLAKHEALKPLQLSSMNVNAGQYDALTAEYATEAGDISIASLAKADQFVFASPQPFGIEKTLRINTDQRNNRPSVEVKLGEGMAANHFTPQGWVARSSDPNGDNIGMWIHFDGAKASYEPGETILPFKATITTRPPRSEVRKAESNLLDALRSKQEFELNRILETVRVTGGAEEELLHFADDFNSEALGLIAPTLSHEQRGIFVLADQKDPALIAQILREHAARQVFLFLPGAGETLTRANLRETFAAEIAAGRLALPEENMDQATLASFVDGLINNPRLGISRTGILQVVTDAAAERVLSGKEMQSLLTGASLLARQYEMVVAGSKEQLPLAANQKTSIYQIVTTLFESARAMAKSA